MREIQAGTGWLPRESVCYTRNKRIVVAFVEMSTGRNGLKKGTGLRLARRCVPSNYCLLVYVVVKNSSKLHVLRYWVGGKPKIQGHSLRDVANSIAFTTVLA